MDAQRFSELQKRIQKSDESALKEIYNEYCKKTRWIAYRIVGNFGFVEDVLNDVLIKVWKSGNKKVKDPDNWIYKTAENTARDYYRKHIKWLKMSVSLDSLSENGTFVKTESETYNYVEFQSLINKLDETEREIIIKKTVFSYTHQEIADELKIPLGTVLWHYQNALKKLKVEFSK